MRMKKGTLLAKVHVDKKKGVQYSAFIYTWINYHTDVLLHTYVATLQPQ